MLEKFVKFRGVLLSSMLTMLCGNPLSADDTEIFFSTVSKVEAQPNILFLLDASESMNRYDCANGKVEKKPCNDGSPFGNVTRLERMNDAMIEIINSTTEVNMGLMRYSNTNSGGRVIYPVRNIDLELCDGEPCTGDPAFSGTRSTVRQELIDTLLSVTTQWSTPSVGGMVEALNYFEGKPVHYGKTRWNPSNAHKSEEGRHSRVSHPDSYTGGQLNQSGECSHADLSHEDCADENISGNPVYISPITNECQANHMLILADGAASDEKDAIDLAEDRVGGSCASYLKNERGECAVELADLMLGTDLRPNIDGIQTVTTHTLGLNLSSNWLSDIASSTRVVDGEDAPGYYEVESTDQLVSAITSIFNGIDTEATTFVTPAATLDRFSRLSHRNDLYLSLFNPSEDASWAGNLKRYELRGIPAELFDANDPPRAVVDPATGRFHASSKSYWSDTADGHDIAAGGAASKLDYNTRKAVTYAGTNQKGLLHEDNILSVDNQLLAYNEDSDITNIAHTGFASQSSVSHSGAPGRAIDGNNSGQWNQGSITHTREEVQPWWQLELPSIVNIEQIAIYNRTNCCGDRLSDVHVFVSETPFGNATLDELLQNSAIWHKFLPGNQPPSASMSVNSSGRYVRVQLAGDDNLEGILSLAEVEVYGGDLSAERLEKERILEWALGRDVKDADEDGNTNENRNHMGDPLHSNPVTVTYGGTAGDPDSVIFVGTNEGYLHAISSRDGSEQFAFMPQELIGNLDRLYNNDQSGGKVYGMDGGLTLWAEDQNRNGIIDSVSNEHAFLYAGMRRGGSSYYAFDVSDRDAPEFKWQITGGPGGTAGFEELGETWSRMSPTTIQYGSNEKKVLVFGGGYDNSQDDKPTRSPDSIGRAIYIVDADTGALLWSGGAGDHDETETFQDMIYSIPATPILLDADGDGATEQIYVGDMGGQIWRFDIDVSSDTLELDGGVIADFGTDGVMSDARRFYHTPDISLSIFDHDYVLNIAIGSGYQAHPLNTTIDDRFYVVRYPVEYAGDGNYGVAEDPAPGSDADAPTTYEVITERHLYNATANLIGQGSPEEKDAAQQQLLAAEGWFIEMEGTGEKVLGSSVTFNNTIQFTSYTPGNVSDPCSPHVGTGTFWALNLLDATPAVPFDDVNDQLNKQDRNKNIPTPGIPPAPQTLIVPTITTDEDGNTLIGDLQVITSSGGNTVLTHDIDALVERVYWSEYPDF